MAKTVLFVVTKSNWGGTQRYVYDLATHLPDGLEPVVAFGGTGSPGAESGRLAEMLKEKGIRTIFIPELKRNISLGADVMAFWALCHILKIEKPDILHLNSSKVGGLGALAGRLARVKHIVFTAHGWPFWEDRHPIVRGIIFLLSWCTVLLSHTTICISKYDACNIRWMPFIHKKIRVIYNGVPDIQFLSRGDAQSALFSADDRQAHAGDLWVVTNAELHPNKNMLTALAVIKQANQRTGRKIFYSIMGDGEQKTAIELRLRESGLQTQVRMLGFIPNGRIYMNAFDAFFLPSKKEGVPYVILEAGLSGLPVVASNVGGIPEAIEDGASGMLRRPDDMSGFVDALISLQDTDTRETLGEKLRMRTAAIFPMRQMLDQTFALYSDKRER